MNHSPGVKTIHVLFSAAESAPFIKVGGLGDVAGSLPSALRSIPPSELDKIALDVRLVIPYHSRITLPPSGAKYLGSFLVPAVEGKGAFAKIYYSESNGVPVYLIAGTPIQKNAPVYSSTTGEDGDKYVFFSKAVLLLPKFLQLRVDILHSNDWHTGLVNFLLSEKKIADPALSACRSLITIHNLPFMGGGIEAAMDRFGVPPADDPGLPGWSRRFPLPMALSTADKIVAVSPTYANELLTPEFGCGLEGFLASRKQDLTGIINGIDVQYWDPTADPSIPVQFSASTLEKRKENKLALLQEFNLNLDPNLPLIAMVSRVDPQKGVDLIPEALRSIRNRPWQAVLLGSGDSRIEDQLKQLAGDMPSKVKAVLKFDLALSHRIYAGSDILLMPSRYEPCGLSQMIAMRYGCLPVARATGGLVDTILDPVVSFPGTGFLYQGGDSSALALAVQRAIRLYQGAPFQWEKMQLEAMRQDFSWDFSAKKYAEIYLNLTSPQ